MSTSYRTIQETPFAELFDGRLEKYGVREHIKADTTGCIQTDERTRCLTDGRNYLWLFAANDGKNLSSITRWGMNSPDSILDAVTDTFETDIHSEYEPQYWGFASEEEWGLAWKRIAEEDEARLATHEDDLPQA